MSTIKMHNNRTTKLPSDEEEAEINRHAVEDNNLLSNEELMLFKPLEKSDLPQSFKAAVRRGRPPNANPKLSLTVRYSPEVVKYFKATGKGWQTRMDDVLKKYVASHR